MKAQCLKPPCQKSLRFFDTPPKEGKFTAGIIDKG